MTKKQPPMAAYVINESPKWPSDVPCVELMYRVDSLREVAPHVAAFLCKRSGADWLGIDWPLHSQSCEPAAATKCWIEHVTHFDTTVALERDVKTKDLVQIIRDEADTWTGQFFGRHKLPHNFTEACGVLLAIAFGGLPFECRASFLHGAFDDLIFFSEYNEPNPGPHEQVWHRTCVFVHRTWREVLHVAFCVLLHRATSRRTHQALCDCAQFYDNAVSICQNGEARPFRFYWHLFETMRVKCQLNSTAVVKLRMVIERFAEKEGGRHHGCNQIPMYWRLQQFREPDIDEDCKREGPRRASHKRRGGDLDYRGH